MEIKNIHIRTRKGEDKSTKTRSIILMSKGFLSVFTEFPRLKIERTIAEGF
jgi:hypothetical protein